MDKTSSEQTKPAALRILNAEVAWFTTEKIILTDSSCRSRQNCLVRLYYRCLLASQTELSVDHKMSSPKTMVRAYARTIVFGYPFNFREFLTMRRT